MTTIVGKTILLTGASRGIGALLANTLAQEQEVTIVGVSRSDHSLAMVGAEVAASGARWIGIPSDISQIDQLPLLVETIQQAVGRVDILINNAGIEMYQAFQDYSTTDVQAVINTNLIAAMELTRLLLPNMLSQGSGHIVNITSLAAKKGHPYDSIYSASKAGLQMWSDAIRQELSGTGVEVSIVCPGYISDHGLMADTGIPAPQLAGSSTADRVVQAVLLAIRDDRAEIWVNQNWLREVFTMFLFALCAVFPRFTDFVYHLLGVPQANLRRIKPQRFNKPTIVEVEDDLPMSHRLTMSQ
jgi:short-subunit dehydrogenase